jgi:hypothetical protein
MSDLLVPRYKVIADYPGCPYDIGVILIADENGELYNETYGYTQSAIKIMAKDAERFKHLVKPLQWWEERKPEEMPEYVKCLKYPGPPLIEGAVYKIQEWLDGDGKSKNDSGNTVWIFTYTNCFEPATEADFLSYTASTREHKEGGGE